MNERDSARKRIEVSAQRRRSAERQRTEAMLELGHFCRAARRLDIPVSEIADLAGMSRQAIYDLLERSQDASR